jgi:hypothetical protein
MRNEKLIYAIGNVADAHIIEANPETMVKTIKAITLFKKPAVLVAAIIIILTLCAFTVYTVYNYLVAFPVNEDGKSEYNVHIFDTTFVLSVDLPAGVTLDFDSSLYPDGISGVFSNLSLVSADGETVGYVGYNIYDMEQLAGITEDDFNPLMVYHQIGLGAHYRFTVRESYEVINDTEELSTAITAVFNDMASSQEERADYSEEEYNYGIVSYSKTLPVYVAFDLNKEVFTQEQIENIARSISFVAEN